MIRPSIKQKLDGTRLVATPHHHRSSRGLATEQIPYQREAPWKIVQFNYSWNKCNEHSRWEVIDKLKLLAEKHPSIQGCMVNHADIPLTKHCSVTFKIGGYENDIGMTREALLYDRKIHNEGEANTYNFRQRVDKHSCTNQTNSHPTKESRDMIRLLHSHYEKF